MNYRCDKYNNKLSILGFGCMRFPTKLGKIDMQQTEQLVIDAIKNGVNYFDTAYIYPGSESALGEILYNNNLRNKVYIATKLPQYLIKSKQQLEKLFNEQLKRLKTDYVDFYLMHMLTDTETWSRLTELGICDWINEKKKQGKIKQIGFSYHGNSDMFCKLIDEYSWDFSMIQYNYMDEHSQAGKTGLKYANSKGIPVMIMEPLRGGRLVNRLPEKAIKLFKNHTPEYTPAQWAFKWLWNQPEITVVLSGMNSSEMLTDNIYTASNTNINELKSEDEAMLNNVAAAINEKMKVGCTGCGYCMPCPQNVDIPGTFAAYNRKFSDGWFAALKEYFMCTVLRKNHTCASNCIGCGKCEKHCPQNIQIRKELENAKKALEVPVFKIAKAISKLVKF